MKKPCAILLCLGLLAAAGLARATTLIYPVEAIDDLWNLSADDFKQKYGGINITGLGPSDEGYYVRYRHENLTYMFGPIADTEDARKKKWDLETVRDAAIRNRPSLASSKVDFVKFTYSGVYGKGGGNTPYGGSVNDGKDGKGGAGDADNGDGTGGSDKDGNGKGGSGKDGDGSGNGDGTGNGDKLAALGDGTGDQAGGDGTGDQAGGGKDGKSGGKGSQAGSGSGGDGSTGSGGQSGQQRGTQKVASSTSGKSGGSGGQQGGQGGQSGQQGGSQGGGGQSGGQQGQSGGQSGPGGGGQGGGGGSPLQLIGALFKLILGL